MRSLLPPNLFPTDLTRPSFTSALILFAAGAGAVGAETIRAVPFEVLCTVTDRENTPLAGVKVRLELRSEMAPRVAGTAGVFRTDSRGKVVAHLPGEIASVTLKRPTNYMDSVFSRKEAAHELRLAAELEYLGAPFLYVIPLHRFRADGAVLYGRMLVYAPDERGNFTREVVRDKNGGWHFPNLGDQVINDPGYSLASAMFHPDETDPTGGRWLLKCQLKQSPAPVRR